MVVILEGSPISTEELWCCQSGHWVLGRLHNQGPSPPIAQLGWAASSRKSLVGSKRLPFMSGGHCVLGDLQCCRRFLDLDTILSRSSRDNAFDLTSWFLL